MADTPPPQPIPSKEELLAKLKEGAEAWNSWRQTNPDNKLDWSNLTLQNTDLRGYNLGHINFSNAYFQNVHFSNANLFSANFSNAQLIACDLQRAMLAAAKFDGAVLADTELREANLEGVDLRGVNLGLLPSQLAGTDLTAAKLPEPTAKLFEKLGSVSEISDSAKKLFLGLLAGCLYCWLTIGTTKDVDLITNRASSPLPIIQTAIPIVGFYVVAPIILLCIYFYFHFYLQKLWQELAKFPGIFPDGTPLHERADPWLFNDLVRAHFSRLKKDRPFLSYFQQWLSILVAWWLVPITLLLFWGRYLPRHDLAWTLLLALLLAISIVSAIQLYRLAREALRGDPRTPFEWKAILKRRRTYTDLARTIVVVAALILISRAAIYGTPQGWVARAMGWVRYSPFANLTDADVSIKPPNWTGKKGEELELVKGANLSGQDLRYASAERAFLVNAKLSQSRLEGADLRYADLRDASFWDVDSADTQPIFPSLPRHANLRNTNLENARMNDADLTSAIMAGAKLSKADLSGAKLPHADLHAADIAGTDFTEADLSYADVTNANLDLPTDETLKPTPFTVTPLIWPIPIRRPTDKPGSSVVIVPSLNQILYGAQLKYADLRHARGLTPDAIIRKCRGWRMAFFDGDMLKQLGLPTDHNGALADYLHSGSKEPFDSWQLKWRQKKAEDDAKMLDRIQHYWFK